MFAYAIWIDKDHAKLFKFIPNRVEKTEIKRKSRPHNPSHKEHEKNDSVHRFYKEIARKLIDANEIYILGAGVAKNEFKSFLEKHHFKNISKFIVGIESMDHSTDIQIEKKARSFFTHRDIFN